MKKNVAARNAAHATSAAAPVELDRLDTELRDGTILVFSDAHYGWGEPASTAHRALVKLAGELQPALLVANGDMPDGLPKHQ
jgi:predicted MPP superfamily phosphohydrolase